MGDDSPRSAIRVSIEDRIATLEIDRPPLNILDLAALELLREAVAKLATREDVQVVIVRGGGERAFSAGVAIEDHVPERIDTMLERFHDALRGLMALDAVTIAAVRGHCLGGGMELAAACDLIVAADDARFGQPEIALGCYPPFAAALYPRLLGAARAADLLLTGRTFDVDEAERIGFVARRGSELDEVLDRLVEELLAHSGAALRITKRALRAGREQPFAAALTESERLYRDELTATADMGEGIDAFLSKRSPTWRHR